MSTPAPPNPRTPHPLANGRALMRCGRFLASGRGACPATSIPTARWRFSLTCSAVRITRLIPSDEASHGAAPRLAAVVLH
eukprot:5296224-Alexandrium_andersonii.AAC.1